MHLLIKTEVAASPDEVWRGFNRELFLALNPPFPPVRLHQFGMNAGDRVRLELRFSGFVQHWVSYLPESGRTPGGGYYFVDTGEQLPFFLASWQHRHGIEPTTGGGSVIIDDIHFEGPHRILSLLLYPALWLQFVYRKPIYRRFFGRPKAHSSFSTPG